MRVNRIARLDNLSFDKYGVIFSYLTRPEKQEIVKSLSHYDAWKIEYIKSRQEMKPNFIKLLNKVETPAGAVKLVAEQLDIDLTYCPYEADNDLLIDALDQLIMAAEISAVERMTEFVEENYV